MLRLTITRSGFALIALALLASSTAHAQVRFSELPFNLPVGSSAGAVLNQQIMNDRIRLSNPDINGPTDYTKLNPTPANITIEPGVLPSEGKVQGVLQTPDGKMLIGPSN